MTTHTPLKILALIVVSTLLSIPSSADSDMIETLKEKSIKMVMRSIGHEVLKNHDEFTSRVLPIEKQNERYQIDFESSLDLDPAKSPTTVGRFMVPEWSSHYLVETILDSSYEVVHSYEVSPALPPGKVACQGRILPEGKYTLYITLIDQTNSSFIGPLETG